MFNDKYGLTQAVLEGRKTQTRRIIPKDFFSLMWDKRSGTLVYENGMGDFIDVRDSKYTQCKVGEVVAVAQSYKDVNAYYSAAYQRKHSIHGMTVDALDCVPDEDIKKWFKIRDEFKDKASWNNKMFVKPEYMPHQIRITDVRVEKLQDITNECCLKEGVRKVVNENGIYIQYYVGQGNNAFSFENPREAFAHLINKVTRKDVWSQNPYVFVYDFELVK